MDGAIVLDRDIVAHLPRQRPPDARPHDPLGGDRHPPPHGRTCGQADRCPRHLGVAVDADHRGLRRRDPLRPRGLRRRSSRERTRRWRPWSATRCASTRSPAPCRPSRSRTWSPSATSRWSHSAWRWSAGSPARSTTTSTSSAPTAGCCHCSSRSWSPASRPSASSSYATTSPADADEAGRGDPQRARGPLPHRHSSTSLPWPRRSGSARASTSTARSHPRGYRLLAKVPRLPAAGRRPVGRTLRDPAEAALGERRGPAAGRRRRRAPGAQRA